MNQSDLDKSKPDTGTVFIKNDRSNVWTRINEWLGGNYLQNKASKNLHALFAMEQIRQDDSVDQAGKLSSTWAAWRFHFPKLNTAIQEYADGKLIAPMAADTDSPQVLDRDKVLDCLTKLRNQEGNPANGYEVTLIGDPKDFTKTVTGPNKGKSFPMIETYRAAFAAIQSNAFISPILTANEDYVRESIMPDSIFFQMQAALGLRDRGGDAAELGFHESQSIVSDIFKQDEIKKDLICVSCGPKPVVLTRNAYEFCNYYLQHVAEISERIPSYNYSGLMSKHFKVPTAMKNFRFDITNIRGLEAATALTSESFVHFINQLLKKHLSLEVAAKLERMKYEGEPSKQLTPKKAEELFQRFRDQTKGFGFMGPKSLSEALANPQLANDELQVKLDAEIMVNKGLSERLKSVSENLNKSEELNNEFRALVDSTQKELQEAETNYGMYAQKADLKVTELAKENAELKNEIRQLKSSAILNTPPKPLSLTPEGNILGGDSSNVLGQPQSNILGGTEVPPFESFKKSSLLDELKSSGEEFGKLMDRMADGIMDRIDIRAKKEAEEKGKDNFKITFDRQSRKKAKKTTPKQFDRLMEDEKPKSKTKPKSKKSAS